MMPRLPALLLTALLGAAFLGSAGAAAQGGYRIVHGIALEQVSAGTAQVAVAVPAAGWSSVSEASYGPAAGMAVDGRIPALSPVSAVVSPSGQAVAVLRWRASGERLVRGRVERDPSGFVVIPVPFPLPTPPVGSPHLITCIVGRGCRVEPPLPLLAPIRVAAGAVAVDHGAVVPASRVVGDEVAAAVFGGVPLVPPCRPVLCVRPVAGGPASIPAAWPPLRGGWAVAMQVLPSAPAQDASPVAIPRRA